MPVTQAMLGALWTEVLARPAELEARGVLADAYTALGDPRGPFMQASLRALVTGSRAAGHRTALRAFERTWLGAMADEALAPRVWRGGVLAGFRARSIDECKPPRPEWRLVEELRTWIPRADGVGFLTPERFPALRVLGLVDANRLHPVSDTGFDVLAALDRLGMIAQLHTIFLHIGQRLQWARTLRPLAAWARPEAVVLVADWAAHDLPDELHQIVRRFRTASLPTLAGRRLLKRQLWPVVSVEPRRPTRTTRSARIAYDLMVNLPYGADDHAGFLAQVFADARFGQVSVRSRREAPDRPEWDQRAQLEISFTAEDPQDIGVAAALGHMEIVGHVQPSGAVPL